MAISRTLLAVASVVSLTTSYELKAKYDASNFFDDSSFRFYNGPDKSTQGPALYISKEEATSFGLARIEGNKVHLGIDIDQVPTLRESGDRYGRKSVRLEGVQTFDSGLFVADFDHLPSGCGIWPALWLLHDTADQEDWYSEFNIIEGVSKNTRNVLSAAQTPCKRRDSGGSGETREDPECMHDHNCGVNGSDDSFGRAFNDRHGGVWAAQVEKDGIKAWFFARGSEPLGWDGPNPDPSRWGKPMKNFARDGCGIQKGFKKMKITLNITFCGRNSGGDTWSGYSGYAAETHGDSCNHFVATDPSKLKEAFYLINSLRVYQNASGDDYPENSLASAVTQTAVISTTTAEQAVLPVAATILITTIKLLTLPAPMTQSAGYGPYDSLAFATTSTTLVSFYGKRLSVVTSKANSEVVVVTTIITTTKAMTMPATPTGGDNSRPCGLLVSSPKSIGTTIGGINYGPYHPSAEPSKYTSTTTGGIDYAPYDPSVTSTKLVGTTIGGINYSPYDPSATSTKPTGTTMGVTNYTTIQTYRTSSKKAATESLTVSEVSASSATEAMSAKVIHACG